MKKLNKKAIQISVNFIVLLILGISMFAGGLIVVNKFFKGAQNIKGSLDSQTERQIEAILDSGTAFAIPVHTKEVHRKDYVTYGVGVYHDGRYDDEKMFTITTTFDSAFAKNTNSPMCQSNNCNDDEIPQIRPPTDSEVIAVDGKHTFLVLAEVPPKTKAGSYIFNVNVATPEGEYEPGLQMIVKVV